MLSLNEYGRYKPLYIDGNIIYAYNSGKIYCCNLSSDIKFEEICSLPMNSIIKYLSLFRKAERMLRTEPRAASMTNDNSLILSFCGAIYAIDLKNGRVMKEHSFREGMNNPLSFADINGIDGFEDCTAYGEYWGNPGKEPVAIYTRKNKTAKWDKIFEFLKNAVAHIHSIIPDKINNRVLILTGDEDQESGIWVAKDNFRKIEPLLFGKQEFRCCAAIPISGGIIFATDTPLEQNYIGFIDENTNCAVTRLYELNGPCIYYCKISDTFFFATSVEPDSRIKDFRCLLSYRLGKGVKDRNTTLVAGNNVLGFKEIISFKKDIFPMGLFQFGNIWFPAGRAEGSLVMCPQSVKKFDGKMLEGKIQDIIKSERFDVESKRE